MILRGASQKELDSDSSAKEEEHEHGRRAQGYSVQLQRRPNLPFTSKTGRGGQKVRGTRSSLFAVVSLAEKRLLAAFGCRLGEQQMQTGDEEGLWFVRLHCISSMCKQHSVFSHGRQGKLGSRRTPKVHVVIVVRLRCVCIALDFDCTCGSTPTVFSRSARRCEQEHHLLWPVQTATTMKAVTTTETFSEEVGNLTLSTICSFSCEHVHCVIVESSVVFVVSATATQHISTSCTRHQPMLITMQATSIKFC